MKSASFWEKGKIYTKQKLLENVSSLSFLLFVFWGENEFNCIAFWFNKLMHMSVNIMCRYYFAQVNLGQPPKPYFLDPDTGSDLTWLQCDAPCVHCTRVYSAANFANAISLIHWFIIIIIIIFFWSSCHLIDS